eukprot:Pgem_evm1s6214
MGREVWDYLTVFGTFIFFAIVVIGLIYEITKMIRVFCCYKPPKQKQSKGKVSHSRRRVVPHNTSVSIKANKSTDFDPNDPEMGRTYEEELVAQSARQRQMEDDMIQTAIARSMVDQQKQQPQRQHEYVDADVNSSGDDSEIQTVLEISRLEYEKQQQQQQPIQPYQYNYDYNNLRYPFSNDFTSQSSNTPSYQYNNYRVDN